MAYDQLTVASDVDYRVLRDAVAEAGGKGVPQSAPGTGSGEIAIPVGHRQCGPRFSSVSRVAAGLRPPRAPHLS